MFEQISKFANEATSTITDTVTDVINDNDITTRFTTTSDQVLDAVLDANRRFVDVAVTTADRVADQINFDLTLSDRLPTPTVAGERYLDFVERAVSLNRDMNQRVVEMIKADNATKSPAKQVAARTSSVKQAVAKKSPARKAVVKKNASKKAVAKKSPARKTVARKTVASK